MKTAHVSFVLASGGLFAVRAAVVLLGSGLAMRAPVRYLSYAIDTALLAAALMLLAILRLNPLATPWLAAKLGLLAAYIMLGSLALKRARGSGRRALAAAGALLCFLAMIAVARTHDPLGFLRWL
ncbi:MAG TPA: SirB2 family protein [Burkholderiales bacterium]|nr:SirB2 family protein [Burkholderiales bacterium]